MLKKSLLKMPLFILTGCTSVIKAPDREIFAGSATTILNSLQAGLRYSSHSHSHQPGVDFTLLDISPKK